jgi:hypothetical protein
MRANADPSLDTGPDGASALAIDGQQTINRHASALGISITAEDGIPGPDTREAFESVAWHLGVDGGDPLDAKSRAWEVLRNPDLRSSAERLRATRRQARRGRPLTTDELLLGIEGLHSIDEWESWVNRRVEKLLFASDLLTFRSHHSVDLNERGHLQAPSSWGLLTAALIPLTSSTKWLLTDIDLLDEAGRSMSLATRDQHGTLAASILIALAYLVGQGVAPVQAETLMPREIEEDLRAIAHEDALRAEEAWADLGNVRSASPHSAEWRMKLTTSERFMALAYDLSRTFLLSVITTQPDGKSSPTTLGRRIIKLDCVRSARRPRAAPGHSPDRRLIAATVPPSRALPSPGPDGVGHICMKTRAEFGSMTSPLITPAMPSPIRIFTVIRQPSGDGVQIPWASHSETWAANLPVGTYEIEAHPADGYYVDGMKRRSVTIQVGSKETVEFEMRVAHVSLRLRSSIEERAPRNNLRRRMLRSVGLASQAIVVELQLAEGGSLHFEIGSPPGTRITRAKLVSRDGDIIDATLESSQLAHLYVPDGEERPRVGYAVINIRLQPETIIRAAATSAWLAAALLVAIATKWWVTGSGVTSGASIVLAAPGAFSLYAAQSAVEPIINPLVRGLRALALVPGACCLAAAAFIATTRVDSASGRVELSAAAAVATLSALFLSSVSMLTRHPPEQRPTLRAQGVRFEARYLAHGAITVRASAVQRAIRLIFS